MRNELTTPNRAEVQAPKSYVKSLIQSPDFLNAIHQALPDHIKPEHIVRIATTAMEKNPKIKTCTTASIINCLMDCATLGLEPDGRRAHLIPYKTECKLILDYKGLVELVFRTGLVSKIQADVVCENDQFSYNFGEIEYHRIDFRKPRGDMYAVYAVATMKDGTRRCEVMTREEVELVRRSSRASTDTPWTTYYNEMAKKTVFRRLCKWLPYSSELDKALQISDAEYAFPQGKGAVVVQEPARCSTERLDAILFDGMASMNGNTMENAMDPEEVVEVETQTVVPSQESATEPKKKRLTIAERMARPIKPPFDMAQDAIQKAKDTAELDSIWESVKISFKEAEQKILWDDIQDKKAALAG